MFHARLCLSCVSCSSLLPLCSPLCSPRSHRKQNFLSARSNVGLQLKVKEWRVRNALFWAPWAARIRRGECFAKAIPESESYWGFLLLVVLTSSIGRRNRAWMLVLLQGAASCVWQCALWNLGACAAGGRYFQLRLWMTTDMVYMLRTCDAPQLDKEPGAWREQLRLASHIGN